MALEWVTDPMVATALWVDFCTAAERYEPDAGRDGAEGETLSELQDAVNAQTGTPHAGPSGGLP